MIQLVAQFSLQVFTWKTVVRLKVFLVMCTWTWPLNTVFMPCTFKQCGSPIFFVIWFCRDHHGQQQLHGTISSGSSPWCFSNSTPATGWLSTLGPCSTCPTTTSSTFPTFLSTHSTGLFHTTHYFPATVLSHSTSTSQPSTCSIPVYTDFLPYIAYEPTDVSIPAHSGTTFWSSPWSLVATQWWVLRPNQGRRLGTGTYNQSQSVRFELQHWRMRSSPHPVALPLVCRSEQSCPTTHRCRTRDLHCPYIGFTYLCLLHPLEPGTKAAEHWHWQGRSDLLPHQGRGPW